MLKKRLKMIGLIIGAIIIVLIISVFAFIKLSPEFGGNHDSDITMLRRY